MLEYYVFRRDFNRNRLEQVNIFSYVTPEKIRNGIKERNIKTKDKFKEFLKGQFMYYFWAKCEHEVVINSFPYLEDEKVGDNGIKIDIWYQIEPNLDLIVDYVIYKLGLDFHEEM